MIIANNDEPEKNAPAVPPKSPSGPPSSSHLDQLPPPPPYTPAAGPSTLAVPAPQARPAPRSQNSIFRPHNAQTVNHFELFSKHDSIQGTYLVDPSLPAPGVISNALRKQRKKRNKTWGKNSRVTDINASFRTRHGAISLDVAAVAPESPTPPSPGDAKVPACIVVSTRHGRVNLNLFEVQPGRSVDLQVESRHGKITILLPPTYDGPLMFETRNPGAVTFLPAFAARTRTLRAGDRETLVVCTAPDAPRSALPSSPSQPGPDDGDRVYVRTRHGRITVGISGLDRVEEAPPGGGLLQKLGELLEVGGRALGQYVEAHATVLEKKLTERSARLGQALDAKFAGLDKSPSNSPAPRAPYGR